MKFIYVMDKKAKKVLLSKGYKLLKVDEENSIWCFENQESEDMEFDLGVPHVLSDILTF